MRCTSSKLESALFTKDRLYLLENHEHIRSPGKGKQLGNSASKLLCQIEGALSVCVVAAELACCCL